MNLIHHFSAHRYGGWQGQYNRMVRWGDRFKELTFEENESEKTHSYFDVMFACFQNIFFLKDWIKQQFPASKEDLNEFINCNKEIGVCRDICNGTKHYDISDASIDKDFGLIRSYNPLHELNDTSKWTIIICAGGEMYKPQELISKCISLWDEFLNTKLRSEKYAH